VEGTKYHGIWLQTTRKLESPYLSVGFNMSLVSTKPQLIDALGDTENKVLALTGRWGTGKSHLWHEVKNSSKDEVIAKSLYVSLFGVADMKQLKAKIIQSAVPSTDAGRATRERIDAAVSGVMKLASSFHKGFSALDDLALLAVPSILKNRFLVLDDVERKHEKLSIDEVLGFIDEVTQLYGARLVLILNSDQLSDKRVWENLREKVIDQELQLETSPTEAFDIAERLTPTSYGIPIQNAVEACGLTNIRIVRKVIRAINHILGDRSQLPAPVLDRMIPSTTLLAAIHYRGIENGPTFDFVLRSGLAKDSENSGQKSVADVYEDEHRTKWKLLLSKLGINSTDEYEMLVVDYLETGLLDAGSVGPIIDRYVAETELMEIHRRVNEFREHAIWHHYLTDDEIVAEARGLAAEAGKMDANTVTWMNELLGELQGGEDVGNLILENWLAAYAVHPDRRLDGYERRSRNVHPRIQEAFNSIAEQLQAETTLYDAILRIATKHSWGTRQTFAINNATVHDFEMALRSRDIDKFKLIVSQLIEMCRTPGAYAESFGLGIERFIEACKRICADPAAGRLSKLIRLLFDDGKVLPLLE
jgi:hypothetical protein